MFESTDWVLEEPDVSDNTKFEIVHPTVVRPRMERTAVPADDKDGVFSVSADGDSAEIRILRINI